MKVENQIFSNANDLVEVNYDELFKKCQSLHHGINENDFSRHKLELEAYYLKYNLIESLITTENMSKYLDPSCNTPHIRNAIKHYMRYLIFSNSFRSRKIRKSILRLPSNTQYGLHQARKSLRGFNVSDCIIDEVAQSYISEVNFDELKKGIDCELRDVVTALNENINFYEMLLFTGIRAEFKQVELNYWQSFIHLFRLLHNEFPNQFHLKIDFQPETVQKSEIKSQILKYESTIKLNLKALNLFD